MDTLKGLTKAELIAKVQTRDAEIAGLRTRLSVAERNDAPRKYVTPAPSAASIAFRANLAAARDLAIRSGHTVKVGAEHA
ncbi:MAG: hypothetical protein Q8N51_05705 [Gammaproteobacteria bacterium]|nr:hypothetical protein [Gammaproteobacteria bacterium]